MNSPLWYKNAVFYEVYVRAFHDSNADGHGDLRGLTARLDYLQELGVDCLWLMPIYPSPLKDDGYDISDYYGVHPDYGTLEDFEELLAAAHARGLRVITDLVLNHTSDQHTWFQAARRDPSSLYRDYYVWSDDPGRYADARIIFLDTETSNWTWDPVAGQYYWHRFYASQPDLNFANPAVRREMLKVMKFWLDLGVDGFRVDAVPYLFEREGTNCENLPETHAYLKTMRRFVDEHYPGRILLCEANQWPRDVRAYFGKGDEFQLAFHFPLMPRIFMALRRGAAEPIRWALSETPPIPENCQWCTFLRNHDELTLEMVSEEERQWMWQEYAPDPGMRLNLGIRRRLAPLLDNDRRKIELACSLLFSLPGSPILYYGDEIGMGEDLSLPDRNGVRTPMQWDAGPGAGFSKAGYSYSPVIHAAPYHPEKVSVAAQRSDPQALLAAIRAMIALRKAHPVLGYGKLQWLEGDNPAVAAYRRTTRGQQLVILNNLSGERQSVRGIVLPGSRMTDLLTGKTCTPEAGSGALELRPFEPLWLVQDH
ncbi:MAG: maltose alpha-D-glucosyltransferase [Anaerolineales bacterium]|nr:maltose alpha-D-glucosyltransferase [Anaerolineales bacterium]